jgi:hypothetical protein
MVAGNNFVKVFIVVALCNGAEASQRAYKACLALRIVITRDRVLFGTEISSCARVSCAHVSCTHVSCTHL